MTTKPSLMTAVEVAGVLGVRTNTVYVWTGSGILPSYRVGRLLRFDRAEISSWLQDRRGRSRARSGGAP
jgi:excisionase family DNA binding protein